MKRCIYKNLLTAATICLIFTGCATNSSVRKVRDDIENVSRTANQALAKAEESNRIAREADARSKKTEEMVNRSFKKSMYK